MTSIAKTCSILSTFFLFVLSAASQHLAIAKSSDAVRLNEASLVADCQTDNSDSLAALIDQASSSAVALGRERVQLPAGCLAFRTTVTLRSNVELIGTARTVMKLTGISGALFIGSDVSNTAIKDIVIDQQKLLHPVIGQAINLAGATNIDLDRIEVVNATGSIIFSSGSHDINLNNIKVSGSLYHGIQITDSYDVRIRDCKMESNFGFGVILDGTTHRTSITGCSTTGNNIELIGATQGTYQNRIIGNHVEGAGDNCISVSGSETIVMGNESIGCAGNGIAIYGERNIVVGNLAKNNAAAKNKPGWDACIRITPQFGGSGQLNVISGNFCDDDQSVPTQMYGVLIAASTYLPWKPHSEISAGAYRLNNGRIFRAEEKGMTGDTSPVHLSGVDSDGSIRWKFIRRLPVGGLPGSGNVVSGNNVGRVGKEPYQDLIGANDIGKGR